VYRHCSADKKILRDMTKRYNICRDADPMWAFPAGDEDGRKRYRVSWMPENESLDRMYLSDLERNLLGPCLSG
jgi:hypothetical protein